MCIAERFVVSSSMDGSWCFLDMERASCLAQKSAEEDGPLTTARFHPDGLLLATGTSVGAVRIWDIREQKSAANCADHSGNGSVLCLGFSENGYMFASGASDGSAHIWDLRKLKSVQSIAAGNGSGVTAVAFDLSGEFVSCG
jgi:pre-mRNA-processing factor 19